MSQILQKPGMCIPPGVPSPPQLLSPPPPPKPGHERDWGSSRTKLVPLKILPVAPRNASLSGSEFLAPGAITGNSGSAQNIFVRQCQALAQTRPGLEQRVPAHPLRVPGDQGGLQGLWNGHSWGIQDTEASGGSEDSREHGPAQ